ncbi:MAG TPA: sigma-70 family RNA polymerase sigma factor [Polyangiaceae bacterium]|jgi:RNA polymerase sigma-70 factor (ECF subfamily)|nr:sigma-70 family RNA polymerase sigma factor [Polyangiaceae bacterium]
MMSRETPGHDPAYEASPVEAPAEATASGDSRPSLSEDDEIPAPIASPAPGRTPAGGTARGETPEERLRRVVDRHYDALWRTLRYLGVPDASVDDAAQQALCVLARRLGDVSPGTEMPFLFATAVRVASDVRRAARRNRSQPVGDADDFTGALPSAEELVDERKARAILEAVLEELPAELRVVFVFFEVEELSLAEIAALLAIPIGTVSSRLRRARERFQAIVRRRQAKQNSAGAKRQGKVGP